VAMATPISSRSIKNVAGELRGRGIGGNCESVKSTQHEVKKRKNDINHLRKNGKICMFLSQQNKKMTA